jgi:hypothetical protein
MILEELDMKRGGNATRTQGTHWVSTNDEINKAFHVMWWPGITDQVQDLEVGEQWDGFDSKEAMHGMHALDMEVPDAVVHKLMSANQIGDLPDTHAWIIYNHLKFAEIWASVIRHEGLRIVLSTVAVMSSYTMTWIFYVLYSFKRTLSFLGIYVSCDVIC